MRKHFAIFLLRFAASTFGLWLAAKLLGTFSDSYADVTIGSFLVAGLVFSLFNSLLRPLIIILSLPAILLTLGLFMLIVNGFLVYISVNLVPGLDMSFGHAILTGMLLSLINYVISGVLELQSSSPKEA